MRREWEIEKQLAKLRHAREIALYDAREYYDEEWEPIVEGVLRPMARLLQVRVAHKAKVFAEDLFRAYRKRKKRFLKYLRGGREEHELDDEEVERKVGAIKAEAHKEMQIRLLSNRRWEEELDAAEMARPSRRLP